MNAVLFSQMTPPADIEDEFNSWYDEEHIPARVGLAGFRAAARYRSAEASRREYVAVYGVDSLAAFQTPEYVKLRSAPSERTRRILSAVAAFTRFTCTVQSDIGRSCDTDYLYVVAFVVPQDRTDAYDDWYEQEHSPMLMEAKHWQRIQRLEVVESVGGPWTHLTFHYLSSPDALESAERARARTAPIRTRLAAEPWFARSARWIYTPIGTSRADTGTRSD